MDGGLLFCRGWLRSRSDLTYNFDEQSLTSQVDFGWALWKTQKAAAFSQKEKNYLLDVCWTGEETSKARPPLMRPYIEFKRRHRPELSKTDWLIEQQIARYFSWLSTVTKLVY